MTKFDLIFKKLDNLFDNNWDDFVEWYGSTSEAYEAIINDISMTLWRYRGRLTAAEYEFLTQRFVYSDDNVTLEDCHAFVVDDYLRDVGEIVRLYRRGLFSFSDYSDAMNNLFKDWAVYYW